MRILVFQHVDVEHPGTFREFWREAGFTWDTVELDMGETIPPLDRYDMLVVMGGAMDVWQEDQHPWLIAEKAAIRHWVKTLRRPYLGLCLGHQLLAEAVGGSVGLGAVSEVGPVPVALTKEGRADAFFAGLPSPLDTFQWHGAEVKTLPEGAVVLASNEACRVQAMRYGALAYGLQFHIEITASTVEDWGAIPEYKASLEATIGRENVPALVADTMARLPAYRATAKRINDNFLALIAKADADANTTALA
jgi:GMP synthase-like glutamine amidotransferase